MKKVLSLTLALCLAAASALAADTVRIGLMAPLTGPWASEGQEMKQIVDLLTGQLNAKGGVLGKQVEVIAEDDGGDPRTASLAAQRLSTKNITAVVGTYGSSITEAGQSIYDESEIIQIATGSTAVRLTEKGLKYFFRTCPRDDEQGRVAAKMTIISPESFNFWESVVIFMIVILGGSGNMAGVLLGAFLIIGLPEVFREFTSARMLVFGLAMMVMMVVRTQGLLPPRPRRFNLERVQPEAEA